MSIDDVDSAVSRVSGAFGVEPGRFAIRNATRIDARGVLAHSWAVAVDGAIAAVGSRDGEFASACRAAGIDPQDAGSVTDARGMALVPGYVDIHAHGSWGCSFDDGVRGAETARDGHLWHGTTRQVLSLITNPLDVMRGNIANVRRLMTGRPDCLGVHLEGPFLAPSRKGAHDPACLRDPEDGYVQGLLDAADGCIRQITIAPELPQGIRAIRAFADAGVIPAVGHTDADYETTRRAFNAGAGILTHIYNAMNGIRHRAPGPIPAALEDPRVSVELINDGFHVQDPCVRLAFALFPDRICLVTDAMEATGCPDGAYRLGSLDVTVSGGHARLVSNGAIAGSTLTLETAVCRAVLDLGLSPVQAVASATLHPAHALGLDRPNPVTGSPLGLVSPGYAADMLLVDRSDWSVRSVWSCGRRIR